MCDAMGPAEGARVTVPRILDRYRPRIEEGLTEALCGEALLHEILRYHTGLEDEVGRPARALGSLLRPSLVLFTAEELEGDAKRALAAAVALELVHNFSLLHDDIEDHDLLRRGRPAAWSRYGIGQAINAGDLVQTLAFSLVLSAGIRAALALAEATVSMIEGQGLDLALAGKEASVEEYLEMEEKKTGSLFACAFRLGAITAAAPPELEERVAGLGREIGLLFQIRDDILGVWGTEAETGKPAGSDLRARKSLLVAIARGRAAPRDRAILERIWRQDEVNDADVGRVAVILGRSGAREAAETMIAERLARARAILEALPFCEEELEELLVYLAGRSR